VTRNRASNKVCRTKTVARKKAKMEIRTNTGTPIGHRIIPAPIGDSMYSATAHSHRPEIMETEASNHTTNKYAPMLAATFAKLGCA
jgi:hypothetical protein